MVLYECKFGFSRNDFLELLTLSLIKFYMKLDNESDLEIIKNYFPGFEYSGDENIHKAFWSISCHVLADYL